MATLSTDAVLTPVRIRNLSASGALIEGSTLPPVGAVVSISRASLSAEGVLVWRSNNQAGIAFKPIIFAEAWLPKNSGTAQSKVDQIVFDYKNERRVSSDQPLLNSTLLDSNGVLDELASLRSDLLALVDKLIEDVVLVTKHPEIQMLDIAIQRIDRLLLQGAELAKPANS